MRSVVATVVAATAAVADSTVVAEAFTAEARFAVVVDFAAEEHSEAEAHSEEEAHSAVAARSAVESVFVATEFSAEAFVAARFVVAASAAVEAGVGAAGAGDSVLDGAGPIGDTAIHMDTLTILGGELPTMTLTMTPTILLPTIHIPTTGRILTTATAILNAQTRLLIQMTGQRRRPTIRGLPRRIALPVLTP